jgi:drug/metabolite transporter (DMT)-like permease
MSWKLLIGISVVFSAFTSILIRIIQKDKKINPIIFSILFQFMTGFIVLIFGLLKEQIIFPPIQPLMLNLFLMALLYGFANIFIFKALRLIEVSKFTIIFTNRIFFTVLASSILLKEGLKINQLFGLLLIIGAIIIVNLRSTKIKFQKGDLFAILAAILFGFALTNDKYLLKFFNFYTYTFINFMLPSLLCGGIYYSQLKELKYLLKPNIFMKIIILCIVVAISVSSFFWAFQIGNNSSQIVSLSLTNVIVAVLLSIVFLGERENIVKKIIAGILSFVGVLLLS